MQSNLNGKGYFLGVLSFGFLELAGNNFRKYTFPARVLLGKRVYPYSLSAPEIPTADDDRVHVT